MTSQITNHIDGDHPQHLYSKKLPIVDQQLQNGAMSPRKPQHIDCDDDNATVTTACSSSLSSRRSSSSSSRIRGSVSFGLVTEHQHKLVLGDNPSVSTGPPVALDWEPISSKSYDFETYERLCSGRRSKGRVTRISEVDRKEWLRLNGFSDDGFNKVAKEIDRIKASREQLIIEHEGNKVLQCKAHKRNSLEESQRDSIEEYQKIVATSFRESRRSAKRTVQKSSENEKAEKSGNTATSKAPKEKSRIRISIGKVFRSSGK